MNSQIFWQTKQYKKYKKIYNKKYKKEHRKELNTYQKTYYKNNPEKYNGYYQKIKDIVIKKRSLERKNHPRKWKKFDKLEYKKNKDKIKARQLRIKIEVFSNYTTKNKKIECICCNENHLSILNLDHIKGGGNKLRIKKFGGKGQGGLRYYYWLRRMDYPKGYQILCRNCDWSKFVDKRFDFVNKKCFIHQRKKELREK